MTTPAGSEATVPAAARNRYDRMEWAGAFGDLGTLLPFVAAYIGVVGLDPLGVLVAFGVAMIACGLHYRTPVPVQPMKAAGAVASLQAAQGAIGPSAVYAAALVTGAVWLLLGASGWLARGLRRVPPVVVMGVVAGLGFGFMLQGVQLMQRGWMAAALAAALLLFLLRSRRLPAMFALLLLGALLGARDHPELLQRLVEVPLGLRWPSWSLAALRWEDVLAGTLLLALPQMPLTLGNAILALRAEHDRLFPERPLRENEAALSTGLMNMLAGCVGGVPMCHGAGGMAAHVAFGARTGGAVVILGGVLLALGLFASAAVQVLFALFSAPVLGVMLFFCGLQLAAGFAWPAARGERVVLVACAALCIWNVAAGFAVGLLLHFLQRRGRAFD